MKNNVYIKASPKNKGFTLIEMAIFLTVVSMFVSSSLSTYQTYRMKEAIGQGKYRSGLIASKLGAFVGHNSRLPCPADPTLPPSDSEAGLEQCIYNTGFVVGTCDGAVCNIPGGRDLSTDPDFAVNNLLIGTVPYLTLGITRKDSMDGWGGMFTYAVGEELTIATVGSPPAGSGFSMARGVIDQQARDSVTSIITSTVASNTLLPNSFMVAVISHGKNNRGAYNYAGTLIAPCIDPNNVGSMDEENCDGDFSFISTDAGTEIYSLRTDSTDFFDDRFSFFNVINDADKWAYTSGSTMTNKLGGNVGIGINQPEEALHIVGQIKVDNYQSNKICNNDGSNCFNPDIIGGTGIDCVGGLMTGVRNGNTICLEVVGTANITTATCPFGEFMKTIDAGGIIVCEP